METMNGASFARLLLASFETMTERVLHELALAGHEGLTVANEFAMQAIDHGAGSASDLARVLAISRQAAAKALASLETLNYVERVADATDARVKRLHVTERGYDAIAVGGRAYDALYRAWVGAVGNEAVATTVAALQAILDGTEL